MLTLSGGGQLNARAALEVDAEGEAADHDAQQRDQQERAGDRVVELAAADDLEAAGAGVQPFEEAVLGLRTPRSTASVSSDGVSLEVLDSLIVDVSLAGEPAAALRSRAICCTAPSPFTDGFDQNGEREASITSGAVTRNTHDHVEDRWSGRG